MTIALTLAALGFAGTAVALAIRMGGLRAANVRLAHEVGDREQRLEAAVGELELERQTNASQVKILRDRLKQLRDQFYALPDNPDNRRAVLGELDRLLQGEAGEDDRRDEDGSRLSEDGSQT